MPDLQERYGLEACWLWCSRCDLEHRAELWREGGPNGSPAMRWIDDPHRPREATAYA